MQEYQKGKAARKTTYVLKRNRCLLHGQNNTKKLTAVSRTKTTRRRGRKYTGVRPVGVDTIKQKERGSSCIGHKGLGSQHGTANVEPTGALNGKQMVDNVRPHRGINSWKAPLAGVMCDQDLREKTSTPRGNNREKQKERTRSSRKQQQNTQGVKHLCFHEGHTSRGKRHNGSHSAVRKHHGSPVCAERRRATPQWYVENGRIKQKRRTAVVV